MRLHKRRASRNFSGETTRVSAAKPSLMKNGRPQIAVGFLAATLFVLISRPAFADTLLPQVQIEARIVEMNQNATRQLGFEERLAQKFGQLQPGVPAPSKEEIGA